MRPDRRTRPRPVRRTTILLVLVFAALLSAPIALPAQTYWRIPGAFGGAMVGAGAGWALDIAAWAGGDLGGPSLNMTPVGIGLGAVVGFIGGLSADRHLARGETLTRGSRISLRSALFLTPIAIGSAAAFAVINPSEGESCAPSYDPTCTSQPPRTKAMSDEMVMLVGIGGGALVGFIAQHKFARALWPKARVNVAPSGRGIMVSVPVGW